MAWRRILGGVCLGGLLAAGTAYSHHSVAVHFDQSRSVEIQGVVVDFKLRSPHSSLVVDGMAYENGAALSDQAQRWELESASLPGLRRMGIDVDTFEPGDSINVVVSPHRDPEFRFAHVDAGQLSSQARTPDTVASSDSFSNASGIERLEGRWRAPLVLHGDDTPLSLNEAGRAAWLSYDPKLSPASTCESQNIPGAFNAPYLFDIRFDGQEVTLRHEAYGIVRTVEIDGEPSLVDSSGLFGMGSGRAEGDTLIVETHSYPPSMWGLAIATHINGGGADVPSSDQKQVGERYSVSQDGQTLILEYTITDPVYLSAPYSSRIELARVGDDTPMYPYECDVESAAMFSREAGDAALRVGNE